MSYTLYYHQDVMEPPREHHKRLYFLLLRLIVYGKLPFQGVSGLNQG